MQTLSQKVGTQFPYDWSNPSGMAPEVFIRQVIERGLFKDMLKTAHYFGMQEFAKIFNSIQTDLPTTTVKIYADIQIGYQNAQNGRTA